MTMRSSHLQCDVVINDDVPDLVEQLSQRGDGGAGGGDVLHAAAPHQSVQLPVGQSSAARTLKNKA